MPSLRSRSPAAKPGGRSPTRAKTRPAAARKATLAVCSKPVDATIRTDPSDIDAQERVSRIVARKAKADAAAAEAKPAPKKRASKASTAEKAALKTEAAKRAAPKRAASKKSSATKPAKRSGLKRPVRKPAQRRSRAVEADADDGVLQAEAATPDAPATAAMASDTEVTSSEAEGAPRHRGPSGVLRTAVDRVNDPPPASGVPLIDRVSRAVEREITQIEVIVGGHHLKPSQRTEAERRARTLASLARTLSELRKLRSDEDRKRVRDDDAIPRDLDELRRALSRRLDQLVASAARLPAAGDE